MGRNSFAQASPEPSKKEEFSKTAQIQSPEIMEDDEGEDDNENQEVNPTVFPIGFPFCFCPTSDHKITVHDKDPKSYRFVPSCWTRRIPAAGKKTFKGENLFSIVMNKNQDEDLN
jgi:hypothetical protein